MNRGTRHAREHLAELFWPDQGGRARRRLSHSLWQIQDALSEVGTDVNWLESTSDALWFDPAAPYWLDVAEFEERIERFRPSSGPGRHRRAHDLLELEQAVELYRGDFMSGYYEDWVLLEQERLAALHLDALGWLIETAKSQGAYEHAVTYAKRLTHHDPLREDVHREVMRLSVLLGRHSDALRQYERCRSVLSAELGTTPATATTQLYERIARQRQTTTSFPSVDARPKDLTLVGRDRERAAIVELLERGLAGAGGAVLIEGDAGVGKTRLATEAAADATWRGYAVLRGEPGASAGRPYAAIVDALEDDLTPLRLQQLRPHVPDVLLGDVARVMPRLRESPATLGDHPRLRDVDGARRMREAIVQLLLARAGLSPTLLILEDLHASDPETLEILDALAGRLADHRLVLALGYRGEELRGRPEAWRTVRSVDRLARPLRLQLAPLTPFGTGELVRATTGARLTDPYLVARLQRETGGNPLFVIETIRALEETGWRGQGPAEELPLATTLRGLVRTRLARLGDDAAVVLEHAAVAGDHATLTLLTDACVREGDVASGLDELLRRGILDETSTGYQFRHDLVRRVVAEDLAPARRSLLHGRIADALATSQPEAVEALANHNLAAGRTAAALDFLVRAARRAVELHAYATARAHFDAVMELIDRTPISVDRAFAILLEFETVLMVLGDRSHQREVLERLGELAVDDDGHRAEVARRRAWFEAHDDDFSAAERYARAAVDAAEARDLPELLGRSLTALGTILVWSGQPEPAVAALERATRCLDDELARAGAHAALGTAHRVRQRYQEAAANLEIAQRLHAGRGDTVGEAQALGQLAAVRMETGDTDGAAHAYAMAIERSRSIGYRYAEAVNLVNLANLRSMEGRIGAALESYEAASAAFTSLDHRRGLAMVQVNLASVRHTVLGEDQAAESDASAALEYFLRLGDHANAAECLDTLGSIALRRGDHSCAAAHLQRALDLATAAGNTWTAVSVRRTRAELALATGDVRQSLAEIRAALAAARQVDLSDRLPILEAIEARALLADGDPDGALAAARRATADGPSGTELHHLVHWHHHVVAAATGAPDDEVTTALDRAHQTLQALVEHVDPDRRRAALDTVPLHRRIVEAWNAAQPRRIAVVLTAADTPLGRPVTDDERVQVTLTLDVGPHDADQPPVVARRRLLIHLVEEAAAQGAEPTVDDLALLLDVSPATVRRDLRALRDAGHHVTTRGSRAG